MLPRLLAELGLRRRWFTALAAYLRETEGRRLDFVEWPYLYGAARERFHAEAKWDGPIDAPSAWNAPRCEHLLYHAVWREACHPLRFWPVTRKLPVGVILEYGAGIAPLAWALRYDRYRRVLAYDLDSPMSRYGRWRIEQETHHGYVIGPPDLVPPGPYDAIVCVETFEHLQQPLAVAQALLRQLKPGGRLFYDYVDEPEPIDLDSSAGAAERASVLAALDAAGAVRRAAR